MMVVLCIILIQMKRKFCDIDLYSKKPYVNKMGRLWGSSRFMSPEEFELNAMIIENKCI